MRTANESVHPTPAALLANTHMESTRFVPVMIAAVLLQVVGGCATSTPPESRTNSLLVTNTLPGSAYDLTVYVVARGDTLARIAKRFGITVKGIEELNPELNLSQLKTGEVLLVRQQRGQ